MATFAIAFGSLVLYIIAYHTYGRWLSRKLFKLDADAPVPSRRINDGQDYVPTRKGILFGHHFTSIAGTGPIVGPALAGIWGWVPALIWVLVGSIFIGAVHDLGALVVSMRKGGRTIGEVAGELINLRVKVLFLLILFVILAIVMAIFGLVIAAIFKMYPASVLSVWIEIPLAVGMGWLVYRKRWAPHWPASLALALMMGAVVLAAKLPILQFGFDPVTLGGLTFSPIVIWTVILLGYCYIASTLPVWQLLQPRDYINSHQLLLCLALLLAGIEVAALFSEGGAPIVAPAVQMHPAGAPPIMPFLFVTIACGAISGFHCLVGSGTSSKQIASEPDAQLIGYGSMLTEGFLAVLVILACCAGLGLGSQAQGSPLWFSFEAFAGVQEDGENCLVMGRPLDGSFKELAIVPFVDSTAYAVDPTAHFKRKLWPGESYAVPDGTVLLNEDGRVLYTGLPAWQSRYYEWSAAKGLGEKVGAFVDGAGNFVASLGIPRPIAVAIMAVLVASFAATTLDTSTRLQRYVIQELATTCRVRPLQKKHAATLLAVVLAAVVAAVPPPGQTWAAGMGTGGLTLWPIFGATNQLLAGLAFLVVAFYLARRRLPRWFIVGPAILMLVVPFCAMLYQIGAFNAKGWWSQGQYHLVVAGGLILVLQVWMVAEAVVLYPKIRGVLENDSTAVPHGFAVIPVDAEEAEPTQDGGRAC